RLAERHRIDPTDMHPPHLGRGGAGVWGGLPPAGGALGGWGFSSPQGADDYGGSPPGSIFIPFFADERYLATLMQVLADQSYPDIEIVVVNHGSGPDASREFNRVAAERRDPRFRFLTTEDRGPGAARNAAAEAASGDLLLFLDGDGLPK